MQSKQHSFRFLILLLIIILPGLPGSIYGEENSTQEVNLKEMPAHERRVYFEKLMNELRKVQQNDNQHDVTKETIIEGNQIRVLMTNQGSISTPNAETPNADLVWPKGPNGLGYAYEFGPLVAAQVFSNNGDTINIVDDGFLDPSDGDFQPGTRTRWGWEPKLGFSDPNSNEVATFSDLDRNGDGKPDSWPESWYNPVLGRYVWPAFLGMMRPLRMKKFFTSWMISIMPNSGVIWGQMDIILFRMIRLKKDWDWNCKSGFFNSIIR